MRSLEENPKRDSRSRATRASKEEATPGSGSAGGGATHRAPGKEREKRIRELAYLRAKDRGFAPGRELEDWLLAEHEVDRTSRPVSRA